MTTIRDSAKQSHRIADAYHAGRYIITYRTIYQPHYSVNGGYYARAVYRHTGPTPLTKRGRYHHDTADRANRLIGIDLLQPI